MLSVDFDKTLGGFHLKPRFVAQDELVVLLGPSGSGKSLTLRAIAGPAATRPRAHRAAAGHCLRLADPHRRAAAGAWRGLRRPEPGVVSPLEENGGKFKLAPAWMSRDMNQAEPPVIANGVVFAYGNGENTRQAYEDRGLYDFSPERIKNSTHAVLYALDGETGKELYSSGDQITAFNHFSGLSVANGRVYIGTYDSVLYCFGLPGH